MGYVGRMDSVGVVNEICIGEVVCERAPSLSGTCWSPALYMVLVGIVCHTRYDYYCCKTTGVVAK